MGNRIPVDKVSARAQRNILECDACYRRDDEYILCGWHENVVVAFAIVDKTAGTIVEESDDV
jgi:hypothetical protein